MEEVPQLPLRAARELVANALVHRDLGPHTMETGKAIQIRVTPEKLTIQSPGGLRGTSLAQLESIEHAQAAVSQLLYQITKKLKTADGASVFEGDSGGIREVFEAANKWGLPRPVLNDTGVQFTARLWKNLDVNTASRNDSDLESSAYVAPFLTDSPTRNEATIIRPYSLPTTG